MKSWQKVAIGRLESSLSAGIAWFSVYQVNKGVVTVQTGRSCGRT